MPYATLEAKKNQLIRKARTGSIFIAPYASDPITDLTTGATADLAPLPTGYEDLGFCSSDGAAYARAITVSEVTSFGSVEPSRTDPTRDVVTMQATAQETKLLTIGLYTGVNTAGLLADHVTGELQVPKPERPAALYYRVLGLFVDEAEDGSEIYMGRFMPRARVTDFAEQQYTDGDNPVSYQMTWTGYQDSVLGYSHLWIWGGPGWLALLEDAGVAKAAS